jgi:hypothetical protein
METMTGGHSCQTIVQASFLLSVGFGEGKKFGEVPPFGSLQGRFYEWLNHEWE